MHRIGYTFQMMRASWEVLMLDKELLIFPILSGICCIIVLASFAFPLINLEEGESGLLTSGGAQTEAEMQTQRALQAVVTFAFYFCNYFVIIFFNSAIIACAVIRMKGGDPTVGMGLRAAAARLPQIFGWALVSATVGMILRTLENEKRGIGPFISGLLGMAWTLLTFLVIPIMVVESKGPVAAFKDSVKLLKRTWGEQLVGNFSFGLIFFLVSLPGIAALVIAFMIGQSGNMALAVLLGLLGVVYLVLAGLVQSTLQGIFQAAVYLYAREGQAPMSFDAGSLGSAMERR